MTVYRYVRTGRLPAARRGGTWSIDPSDLEAVLGAGTGAAPRGSGLVLARSRLQSRLTAGDEAGAWDLVERALSSGAGPEAALVCVVGGALSDIGVGWATGKLSVADEHRASGVAMRLVSRLGARFLPRGRKRGTVVLAAPQGEMHAVPVAMAADVLRWNGFTVVDLGADTPSAALAEAACRERSLLAVGLACTSQLALGSVASAAAAVHKARAGVPVLLGGGAIVDDVHALKFGADMYTGHVAGELLQAVEAVLGGGRR
jgi:methanogenic corrinoid protein MtbC1